MLCSTTTRDNQQNSNPTANNSCCRADSKYANFPLSSNITFSQESPKILLFEYSETVITIPEEKVTNREYAKYFNVENENEDECEESEKTESQPFRRGARRHNLYFKAESVNQSSEMADLEERQEREQNFVRGSKGRKSVELTVILASRKPSKEIVFLKSGSATIGKIWRVFVSNIILRSCDTV